MEHNFSKIPGYSGQQLKQFVFQATLSRVLEKQEDLDQQIKDLAESMSSEQKSPLGDKHETARARMQAEEESIKKQLAIVQKQLSAMNNVELFKSHDRVKEGACVVTDKGVFYLSVPVGRISIDEPEFFAISKDSPLAQVLLGAKTGDTRRHQNTEYQILEIA